MAIKATDLLEEIRVLADVDAAILPFGLAFVWFADKDGAPVQFLVNKTSPIDDSVVVLGIFEDDSEIRVYCMPVEGAMGEKAKPKRYSLCKISPTFFIAALPIDTFKACFAQELVDLSAATASLSEDGVLLPPLDREEAPDGDDEPEEPVAAAPNGATEAPPATP